MKAAEYDQLIDAVRDCRASLAGCTRDERVREGSRLHRAMMELQLAKLDRKNERLTKRAADWLQSGANELLKAGGECAP
jgi:hypothetical protein